MTHEVTLNWAGGEHRFALRLGELRALQDACNAGPEEILRRLISGAWRIDDLVETLRLGLIGAGMERDEAKRLLKTVTDQRPYLELRPPAQAVIIAALIGPEEDSPGEEEGRPAAPENGPSPSSTAPAP